MTTLKDIMTKDLVTVSEQTSLREVAQLMKRDDIGNVLIMKENALHGIVTDRDIVVRAVAEGQDISTPVGEYATRHVFTMPSETSVEEAARQMAEKQLRRLPVTEQGQVVGIVALADLAVRAPGDADQQALQGISRS